MTGTGDCPYSPSLFPAPVKATGGAPRLTRHPIGTCRQPRVERAQTCPRRRLRPGSQGPAGGGSWLAPGTAAAHGRRAAAPGRRDHPEATGGVISIFEASRGDLWKCSQHVCLQTRPAGPARPKVPEVAHPRESAVESILGPSRNQPHNLLSHKGLGHVAAWPGGGGSALAAGPRAADCRGRSRRGRGPRATTTLRAGS